MKEYNLILVYDKNNEKVLMCKREKEPFKGMLNLVGGKIDPEETDITSAYRELQEETGITRNDIELKALMNIEYFMQDMVLKVFMGKLNKEVKLIEEINKLIWVDKNSDFYDIKKYAGDGNIWLMVHHGNNYIN